MLQLFIDLPLLNMSALTAKLEEDKYLTCHVSCKWDGQKIILPVPKGYNSWADVPMIDGWSFSIPILLTLPFQSEPVEVIFKGDLLGPRLINRLEDEQRKSKDGGRGSGRGQAENAGDFLDRRIERVDEEKSSAGGHEGDSTDFTDHN